MSPRHHPKLLTRRDVMRAMAAASVSAGIPGAAVATEAPHQKIAQWVRDLRHPPHDSLLLLCPDGAEENLLPVIDAFRSLAGIEVRLTTVPTQRVNTVIALKLMTDDSRFDVALPASFGLTDLAASGAIMPLDRFSEKYGIEGSIRSGSLYDHADFFDQRSYGFQTDGDALLMFYNRNMLENEEERARYADAHGRALELPRTWGEFDLQLGWFHRPAKDLWGGLMLRAPEHLAWEWWLRLHAYGVWPFSPDMEVQIHSAEGVAALEDMIRTGAFLHPQSQRAGIQEKWARFDHGRCYANLGWGGSQKFYNREASPLRGRLRYAPPPGYMPHRGADPIACSYFNWGWNYVVSRFSEKAELAYLFCLFASTPEMSTRAVREAAGFFDPYRSEHYADPKIEQVYTREFLDVHSACLEAVIPDLYIAQQSEYFTVLNTALASAIHGDVAPKQALDRAAQIWDMLTSRAGRDDQTARWRQVQSKYPAQLAAVLGGGSFGS